jgi:uncharacterized protein (TIGR02391 family)
MPAIPSLPEHHLEAICQVLADTGSGLTGTEIGRLLDQLGLADPGQGITKWRRLHQALSAAQREHRAANIVAAFIERAMDPVRFVHERGTFEGRRARLNAVLAFASMELGEDGKVRPARAARTISDAVERMGALRAELERRRVHADVLSCCRAELLGDENYFHAVLEATKSVAKKIRERSGLASDGARLIDEAFGIGGGLPRLAFNTLRSESEKSEHTGLMMLMKGVFSSFRNPTAHEPRVDFRLSAQDALDVLSMLSLVHRRLDAAVPTGFCP